MGRSQNRLSSCGSKRRVEVCRQALLQLPDEGDRAVSLVAHVGSRPETPEGPIARPEPGEEDDVRAALAVVDVALADLARG